MKCTGLNHIIHHHRKRDCRGGGRKKKTPPPYIVPSKPALHSSPIFVEYLLKKLQVFFFFFSFSFFPLGGRGENDKNILRWVFLSFPVKVEKAPPPNREQFKTTPPPPLAHSWMEDLIFFLHSNIKINPHYFSFFFFPPQNPNFLFFSFFWPSYFFIIFFILFTFFIFFL